MLPDKFLKVDYRLHSTSHYYEHFLASLRLIVNYAKPLSIYSIKSCMIIVLASIVRFLLEVCHKRPHLKAM